MERWWLVLLLSLFIDSKADAQNDFFFGHYMFNPAYFNPGWIGSEQGAFVAFQHRSQWLGYSGTFDGGGGPNTQMLTAMVPIEKFIFSAAGINVSNDNLGPVSNLQVQLPLTISKELRSGSINVGIAPSLFSKTLKAHLLRPNELDDEVINALGGNETQMRLNLAAGFFYSSDNNFFFGVSALNLLQPKFNFGISSIENMQEVSFAAHGGYVFSLNENLNVSPSFLVRTNLKGYTFDIGAIATLNNKIWGGLSFRKEEALIIYLGYSLLQDNKLKAGYSFDYVIEDQNAKSPTSHEIFIRYDLPDLVFGGRKTVKTPRFTF